MKITVVTQAYNAERYIVKCVESVLNQTYSDFEYLLIDNGSTDNSRAAMEKYAASDNRIKLITYDENGKGRWLSVAVSMGTGDYFMMLDSDDWLEPDCIERMVKLVGETDSDIVTTGSFIHIEGTSQVSERKNDTRIILDKKDFAGYFPYYHVYFRAMWAKLIRMDIIRSTSLPQSQETGIAYGLDTVCDFLWLRNAEKICVDNSILHHYRIHKKSVSHQYDSRQSYSDLYLFNDALDFLSPYGPISENNLLFLHVVYSNAVNDTLNNIKNSTLTASEKSEEYYKILERQVTKDCYKRTHKDIINNKARLFAEVFKAFSELEEIPQKWNEILSFYFPKCHGAISTRSAKLVLMETDLLRGFIDDDSISVIKTLCLLIARNQYTKQFDLPEILRFLSQNQPVISNITDSKFFKKHGDIYLLLYQNKYADALSAMTDTLLKGKVNNETFLQTYLNVAALLEQVDEFIFGKVRTAEFYLSSKRFEECKEILDDLGEMGVEDNEEIRDMKAKLSEQLS